MFSACLLVAGWVAATFVTTPLKAAEISTYVIGVTQGSSLTQTVEDLERGGYELADGTSISFAKWYQTDWVDVRVDMLTEMNASFGILWGGSTGERGEKFAIDPSFKLGFIAQQQPTPNTTLSLSVSTILGGRLTETPCQADYGEIGGVQTVNCRLAASTLAPKDTLQYLLNAEPNRLSVSLSFSGHF